MKTTLCSACVILALLSTRARADEVIFNNGDRLTGTIKKVDGGKLTIKTDVAGEVSVDLKDVKTFSTAETLRVRTTDNATTRATIATTETAGQVKVADKTTPITDIKRISGKQAWTGSVVANGSLQRGNTHETGLGVAADATLRRDDEFHDDRFLLRGAYNFGKETVNGTQSTSADNWFAQAKYDKFFNEKWYGYALMRYDHDRLADLNYRLAPGIGVGYQWVESANFNFSTEAGVSYVYEDYSNDGTDDRVALRLAYHVDKKLNDHVSVFHNLEWLPAFDDPSDYNLNADAGVRAKMTDKLFSEFKIQFERDSTPAPGAEENDLRFLLGVGYTF
jgi:putative salt-induced outer membrane protein YdiY